LRWAGSIRSTHTDIYRLAVGGRQRCNNVARSSPHLRTFVVAASSLYFSTGFSGVNWNLRSFHFTIHSARSPFTASNLWDGGLFSLPSSILRIATSWTRLATIACSESALARQAWVHFEGGQPTLNHKMYGKRQLAPASSREKSHQGFPQRARVVATDLNQTMFDRAAAKQPPDTRIIWQQADALALSLSRTSAALP
jgi:hypothetical protein